MPCRNFKCRQAATRQIWGARAGPDQYRHTDWNEPVTRHDLRVSAEQRHGRSCVQRNARQRPPGAKTISGLPWEDRYQGKDISISSIRRAADDTGDDHISRSPRGLKRAETSQTAAQAFTTRRPRIRIRTSILRFRQVRQNPKTLRNPFPNNAIPANRITR